MGGEPWKIVSPWCSEIERVLHSTRERVFREGSYRQLRRPFTSLDALDAFFMEPSDEDLESGDAFGGTESILDIRAVGTEREPGCTAPLSTQDVSRIFGTETPSAADLTPQREAAIYNLLTRGDSYYVVLYANGNPAEVAFYGYSWD